MLNAEKFLPQKAKHAQGLSFVLSAGMNKVNSSQFFKLLGFAFSELNTINSFANR